MSELHVHVGRRHDRSLSHSDLHLIAHATDVHDVGIGIGHFEYGLSDGATGAEGHGPTISLTTLLALTCYEEHCRCYS